MKRRVLSCTVAIVALVLAAPLVAGANGDEPKQAMPEMTAEQKAEMAAYMEAGTPGAAHKRLADTAGTYDLAIKSWHEPGGPAMESTGTATRSMALEGRVMVEDVTSSMMGMPFTGHGMTGYDNVTGKYWATWNDSMSTGLMVSEGTCDKSGACAFTGSWNDPIKKAPVQARMASRWTSPTVQVFEMHGPGKDGKEMKMMEITYTKK
ncbi:MAG TPA: DUF1579 domain-containing protein [Thermoanaerobaculia bacterium]|nr:DUF1579 domain-containing protein [Thermoanaerobaculia bacterium]